MNAIPSAALVNGETTDSSERGTTDMMLECVREGRIDVLSSILSEIGLFLFLWLLFSLYKLKTNRRELRLTFETKSKFMESSTNNEIF